MNEPKTVDLGLFRRTRDGAIVKAGDWKDGTISWMLAVPPVVSFGKIVGTCAEATFYKGHKAYSHDHP